MHGTARRFSWADLILPKGISPMMLMGDNRQVSRWVSEETGIDEHFAEVLPHEKAEKVKEVQSRALIVAMTGDGVNNAPALAQADVGIAIGASTDVAVESADIVLVRSNRLDVMAIVDFARAAYRKMVQNLAWATGYNALAIPLTAGVLASYGGSYHPRHGCHPNVAEHRDRGHQCEVPENNGTNIQTPKSRRQPHDRVPN